MGSRRAGIRAETLNRIEKMKVSANTFRVSKIAWVLGKVERKKAKAED